MPIKFQAACSMNNLAEGKAQYDPLGGAGKNF